MTVPVGFSQSHALSNEQWGFGLEAELLSSLLADEFTGDSSKYLRQYRNALSNKAGGQETIGLRMQNRMAPKDQTQTVENNENGIEFYDFTYGIGESADAVRFKNVLDRQMVNFDMREEATAALSDQLANADEVSFFNQLAGYNAAGLPATFRGHNTVHSPDSDHWIIVGGGTEAASIGASDLLTFEYIDYLVERAKTMHQITGDPKMRPCKIPGYNRELFVMFVHPWQTTSIKVPGGRWDLLFRDAMSGGMIDSNPIVTGALGIYNGTLVVESDRVPYGLTATDGTGVPLTTVRRGIFCGAQAVVQSWGRTSGNPNSMRWVEKYFDYDREYGIFAGYLNGQAKTRWNDKDFATIVVSSYAQPST